jgi:signal transduction histidine kinase
MRLYLLLLLIPVLGIGLYGHLYLQRTLTQSALQNALDEVSFRSHTVETLLGQVHDDILYLGQRVEPAQGTDSVARDPTNELTGFAASHPMHKHIAWVDLDGVEQGGYRSTLLTAWIGTDSFAQVTASPPNSIRFFPVMTRNDGSATLIAAARLRTGVLLFEINSGYLLQGLTTTPIDDEWALLLQPNTFLTMTDDASLFTGMNTAQFTQPSGYFIEDGRVTLYHHTGPGGTWVLLHSLPRAAINTDMTDYNATFIALLVGGVTSVVGLALLAIALITEPVQQLERMVDQVRRGNPRPKLPKPLPKDEFGVLMTAFDQMAEELDQKRRNERALIEQLIKAQEEERKLIAYDLHDGLIQELVGARFYLGQCRSGCDPAEMESKAAGIEQSYDVLTHAIAEGRRIIQGLHPTVLEDLGLEVALAELANTTAHTARWQIETYIAQLDVQPDRATSVTLYRIAQEALNNAFKHAGASRVCISLTAEADRLRLSVQDDGCGFVQNTMLVSDDGEQHWGIRTMRERAAMLRGTCEISSYPGQGTRIEVVIPFEREALPA